MAITNEFKEVVQSGKVLRIRIMLKDSLLIDPTSKLFDEMLQYASEKLGDIYAEHDGEKLNYDKASWNEDYLNLQMVTLVDNFSKERVDLLKAMVRYLYKDKAEKMEAERANKAERGSKEQSNGLTRKQIGAGVTAAGGVAAVAGICTSQVALTVGGLAVAAVGVALIVSDKGDI